MDSRRLSVSHITTPKWRLGEALEAYRRHGVTGFGPWQDRLYEEGFEDAVEKIGASGLVPTNYCAAGFFTMVDEASSAAVDEKIAATAQAIDEASVLGAKCLVIVSGPVGAYDLASAEDVVRSSLGEVTAVAEEKGVDLGLEVLHPMDMTQWSVVRTLGQALDLIEEIDSPRLGLMLDLYNTWWDPAVVDGIHRARSRIKGVHFADWRNPTRSFTDRALPGTGVAPLAAFVSEIEATGWDGFYDLEIFSDELWESDYDRLLDDVVDWFGGLEG